MKFATIDFIIFFGYALIVTSVALYVSRTKKGIKKSSKEYSVYKLNTKYCLQKQCSQICNRCQVNKNV